MQTNPVSQLPGRAGRQERLLGLLVFLATWRFQVSVAPQNSVDVPLSGYLCVNSSISLSKGEKTFHYGQVLSFQIPSTMFCGATRFNQKRENEVAAIYGCVTTGEHWQFLKLEQETITIDSNRYYINEVGVILAVWHNILSRYIALA